LYNSLFFVRKRPLIVPLKYITMESKHAHHTMEHQHLPAKKQEGKTKAMQHSDHDGHHGHAGHDHHAMMIADFRKRFYIVLILTVPVMLLSKMIQQWLGIDISFTGSNYLLLALASIVFFYGGWPFLTGWWDEMKKKDPGMMTLIGFAIDDDGAVTGDVEGFGAGLEGIAITQPGVVLRDRGP